MSRRTPTLRDKVKHRRQAAGTAFHRLNRRVTALEAIVDPIIDHVAAVERELLEQERRLARLERRPRRTGD